MVSGREIAIKVGSAANGVALEISNKLFNPDLNRSTQETTAMLNAACMFYAFASFITKLDDLKIFDDD